jgi:predicted dehydrogenase
MGVNNDMIGVAIAGTGFGQKVHIPGFKAHHRTEVVAVYKEGKLKTLEEQAHRAVFRTSGRG